MLAYCTITSPVKGTIIDRRVNIGETVISSLNSPSLFLIAKDLTKLQVWAAVNEADVGGIYDNQPVKFTVDAFPNQFFDGKVGRVRLNATMTSNVVTYTVEVNTDNSSGKLLPYLTANALFETGRKEGKVLIVPNAALRWQPTAAQRGPFAARRYRQGPRGKAASADDAQAQAAKRAPTAASRPRRPGRAGRARGSGCPTAPTCRPIPVKVGMTDGVNTEISGEGIEEGLEVITGDITAGDRPATATTGNASPFTPQLPPRKR